MSSHRVMVTAELAPEVDASTVRGLVAGELLARGWPDAEVSGTGRGLTVVLVVDARGQVDAVAVAAREVGAALDGEPVSSLATAVQTLE